MELNTLIKIVAVLIASFGGHYPIVLVLNYLGRETADIKTATILGILERGMYIGAWFLGYHYFIAFWLTLKVAGSWKERGGRSFSRFLVGTSGSVLFAVIVALTTEWVLAHNLLEVLCK